MAMELDCAHVCAAPLCGHACSVVSVRVASAKILRTAWQTAATLAPGADQALQCCRVKG